MLQRTTRTDTPVAAGLFRRKPGRRGFIGEFACIAVTWLAAPIVTLSGTSRALAQQPIHLPQPRSLKALLDQAAGDGHPIVAMFSLEGCAWCEAIRREQLLGLAREQSTRGIQVVEFDMRDERAFDARRVRPLSTPASPSPAPAFTDAGSPAALSRALAIRIAPTVVFLGPAGEVAPRLVGYGARDFFSAYLDERIDQAKAALARGRRPGTG